MNNWVLMVLSLGILLLILLIVIEYRRVNKARLWWRIIATIFAITGFVCLALPITYLSFQKNNDGKIFLLTPGYNEAEVRTTLSGSTVGKVYTTEAGMKVPESFKAIYIQDVSTLLRSNNNRAVHVFGYGFTNETLKSFNKQPIIFHPSELPQGITAVHWQGKLKTGETLRVQGYYNNPSSKAVTIALSSFNSVLDTVVVAAASHAPFELHILPVHLGRAIYQLIAYSGKDTLLNEPVPLEVERAPLLKVLLLASSPDFENKFLKNWLADQGHSVVVKTITSANKFNSSFSNTANNIDNRVTASFLSQFDVVKADAGWFSAVPNAETALLLNAVAANKIGLIVTADSSTTVPAFSKRFSLVKAGNFKQQILLKSFDSSLVNQPLKMESPLYIKSTNTQPVIADQQGNVFAVSALYGSGKLIYTTVTNTFNWSMAGHQDAYASFWTRLLQKVAPAAPLEEAWSIQPFLPKKDQQVTVQLQTNQRGLTIPLVDGAAVYLSNKPNATNTWMGRYWPIKKGWQSLVQTNGEFKWLYAYASGNWKTIDQFDRLQATVRYTLSNKSKTVDPLKKTKKVPVAVPGIYFFLIILLGAAYLWYEKKLSL
jgi:hypothetical protein